MSWAYTNDLLYKNQLLAKMKRLFKQKESPYQTCLKVSFSAYKGPLPLYMSLPKVLGKKCRLMNKSSSLASGQFLLLETPLKAQMKEKGGWTCISMRRHLAWCLNSLVKDHVIWITHCLDTSGIIICSFFLVSTVVSTGVSTTAAHDTIDWYESSRHTAKIKSISVKQ